MTTSHGRDHDEHREGLAHDLPVLQDKGMVARRWGRRGLLGIGAGLGVALVAGCGDDTGTNGSGGTTTDDSPSGRAGQGSQGGLGEMDGPPSGSGGMATSQDVLDEGDIPEETGGPYPADGTNGVNILTASGIVRSDITRSFGDASGVAEGVPLTIRLNVYDNGADGMTPYQGAAIYLWCCDREGRYSLYSSGVESENYLRGVQVADADGALEFTSIFPACYSGRWPHLHFEVYGSVDDATSASNKLRTSQIAFPQDVCQSVYDNAEGYESSRSTFSQVSLDSDGIFSDGYSLQMGKLSGSVGEGYVLTLNVPV